MQSFSSYASSYLFDRHQEEHVIDLQLLACRKKFRGRGLGRHLVKVNLKIIFLHSIIPFFSE